MGMDTLWIDQEDNPVDDKSYCFSCGSVLIGNGKHILKCPSCGTIYNYNNN